MTVTLCLHRWQCAAVRNRCIHRSSSELLNQPLSLTMTLQHLLVFCLNLVSLDCVKQQMPTLCYASMSFITLFRQTHITRCPWISVLSLVHVILCAVSYPAISYPRCHHICHTQYIQVMPRLHTCVSKSTLDFWS